MRVIRWPDEQGAVTGPCVATLGVFDGVHRGHRAVIGRAIGEARHRGCAAAVVTFDRDPTSMLAERTQPALTSPEHRLRLFDALGADVCVVVAFDAAVAEMPAEAFARAVFGDLLDAPLVVLGFDCRFGRGRRGDADLCRRLGFDVVTVPPVEEDGTLISSTAIREAIGCADFGRAAALLGRPYSLYGTVVGGDRRGTHIGFATANLDPSNEAMPPEGVYACWARANGTRAPAVTSIGSRPTFHAEQDAPVVVEVHVIGHEGALYGARMDVEFVCKLRDQAVFADAESLAEQIAEDVRAALRVLEARDGVGG